MPDPPLNPDAIAKMKAALEQLAPLLRRYYASLVEAGFSPSEAMHLTEQLQRALLGQKA